MEDFVPYELAVKLEQKGFKQGYNIFGFRPIFPNETTIRFINKIGAYEKEYFGENIPCPTISQVLKWFREENIHLYIDIDNEGWFFEIKCLKTGFMVNTDFFKRYSTYEQAALAGIEYVIDNLI